MNKGGIYKIQSISKPERYYIGSAVDIKRRWRDHIKALRKNSHGSTKLQRHFNKYGEIDLQFIVLSPCEPGELLNREQYYIDTTKPYFNICKIAGSALGVKRSDETRLRQSKSRRGRKFGPLTEEHKRKVSEALKGRKLCEEAIRRSAEAHRGKPLSEEIKQKLREINTGRRPSEETRRKMSLARTGKRHTAETKRKIGEARKGNRSWLGKHLSEEHKHKLSEYYRLKRIKKQTA